MKTVVLSTPGNSFSSNFLMNFAETVVELRRHYIVFLSGGVSSFVSFARMKTLGLDVRRGPDQKPFDGMEYDAWVTIDSDIAFHHTQVRELIERCLNDYPVVSGLYRMACGTAYAAVESWDETYYAKHGSFQFLTEDVLAQKGQTPFEVAYTGMGFFAVRGTGVFDKLRYPYFHVDLQQVGRLVDIASEDVAFCKNLAKVGIPIVVDPELVVGHEKTVVL